MKQLETAREHAKTKHAEVAAVKEKTRIAIKELTTSMLTSASPGPRGRDVGEENAALGTDGETAHGSHQEVRGGRSQTTAARDGNLHCGARVGEAQHEEQESLFEKQRAKKAFFGAIGYEEMKESLKKRRAQQTKAQPNRAPRTTSCSEGVSLFQEGHCESPRCTARQHATPPSQPR